MLGTCCAASGCICWARRRCGSWRTRTCRGDEGDAGEDAGGVGVAGGGVPAIGGVGEGEEAGGIYEDEVESPVR